MQGTVQPAVLPVVAMKALLRLFGRADVAAGFYQGSIACLDTRQGGWLAEMPFNSEGIEPGTQVVVPGDLGLTRCRADDGPAVFAYRPFEGPVRLLVFGDVKLLPITSYPRASFTVVYAGRFDHLDHVPDPS